MSEATLSVIRKSAFNAMLREAAILVNDQKVGVVGNGKTIEVPIAAGQHNIRARIDWLKSKPLELSAVPGGRYSVELSMCNPFVAILGVVGLVPYLELRAL